MLPESQGNLLAQIAQRAAALKDAPPPPHATGCGHCQNAPYTPAELAAAAARKAAVGAGPVLHIHGRRSPEDHHARNVSNGLRTMGFAVEMVPGGKGHPLAGVPEWMTDHAAKPVATVMWEEHGYLRARRKALRAYIAWAYEQGIAPLSIDRGFLDHSGSYILDLYDRDGHGMIAREWAQTPDAPIDWTREADPRARAWVERQLSLWEASAQSAPVREPGYVLMLGQWDTGLCRLRNDGGRLNWPALALHLDAHLRAHGERLVIKPGPVGLRGQATWAAPHGVIPHDVADPSQNMRLLRHAKYVIIISSNVASELLVAPVPVLSIGVQRWNGRGVFDETADLNDIGRLIPRYTDAQCAARRKLLRWWLRSMSYPDRIGARAVTLIRHFRESQPVPVPGASPREPERPQLVISCRHKHGRRIAELFTRLGVRVAMAHDRPDLVDAPGIAQLFWSRRYYKRHRRRNPLCWWAENGWLPQTEGFYLDARGLHAESSIAGNADRAPQPNPAEIDAWVDALHARMGAGQRPAGCPDEPFLFVPLQVERDVTVRKFGQIPTAVRSGRVDWFIGAICRTFPNTRIVFRQHPKDTRPGRPNMDAVRAHGKAAFCQEGTTWQWCNAAAAVVGINSTVLLEALTFYRKALPVAAFGRGVFTGNGALIEAAGNLEALTLALDPTCAPDPDRARRFLSLLRVRAIPYDMAPNALAAYPDLKRLVLSIASEDSQAALYREVYSNPRYSRPHPRDRAVLRVVRRLAQKHGVKAILDVGCGAGRLLARLSAAGLDARGVDFIQPPNLYCDPARFQVAPATALPFAAGSVDCVTSTDVMEHLSDADLAAALREIRRVSKRWAVFTFGIGPGRHRRPDGTRVDLHLQHKSLGQWADFMRASGFNIHSISVIDQRKQQNVFLCELPGCVRERSNDLLPTEKGATP